MAKVQAKDEGKPKKTAVDKIQAKKGDKVKKTSSKNINSNVNGRMSLDDKDN